MEDSAITLYFLNSIGGSWLFTGIVLLPLFVFCIALFLAKCKKASFTLVLLMLLILSKNIFETAITYQEIEKQSYIQEVVTVSQIYNDRHLGFCVDVIRPDGSIMVLTTNSTDFINKLEVGNSYYIVYGQLTHELIDISSDVTTE